MRSPFSLSIARVASKADKMFLLDACTSAEFSVCTKLFLQLKLSTVIFLHLQKNRFLIQYGSFHPKSDKLNKFCEISRSPVHPGTHPKNIFVQAR